MREKHLAHMIRNKAQQYGGKIALRAKSGGQWKDMTYEALGEQVRAAAKALLEMGVREGEMVGIFSQNRPEWAIADYGILSVRAVSVPIYATNTARQAEYIVNDAEIRILFVGDTEQYEKITTFFDGSPYLKKIIVFDEGVDLGGKDCAVYFRDFIEAGRASKKEGDLNKRLDEASVDDLATLIYTSGTTGEPKGVMLHHSNFHHSFMAHDERLDVSDRDVSMCFLPLTHVFERAWSYFALGNGMTIAYCDDTSKIVEYLQDVKPTVMCAVPRFYEKIYSAVFEKLETAPPKKKKLFLWAVRTGEEVYKKRKEKEPIPVLLGLRHRAAEALVLKKIQGVVGGRIRFFPCAGAPLSRKIEEFFHSVGIRITYGYGLTETTATVTCHENFHFRPGTVGKPIMGVEVKIAPDGEILVRGGNVMKGYYKKPAATAEVFEDGWFKTGDVGVMEEGYLTITDRIKDLMKTSGGKYIAPQYIETTIGNDHFIEQISIIGDERKYVSALIVPSFDALEEYARSRAIPFSSREELVRHPDVMAFYRRRIDDHQKELADYEKVKRFTLLAHPFTQESGEMTPTMKLKRKVIAKVYRELIDAMYDQG
jgi:long-chain acyl-CoA synthetase